jgi:hypothetical protein
MYCQFRTIAPRQSSFRAVGALVVVVGALAAAPAGAQEQLLWGGLKPGPYAVGFRKLYQLDHTWQYDPEYATDPAQPLAHRPRPILICAWYPAEKTGARPMEYRQYLDVSSDDAQLAPFVKRLSYNIHAVVCEETVGKAPAKRTPAEAAAFDRFLATKTFAVKDATPAEGRFPVVIYHPGLGGTYEDNSALFEYLASHGYVVLSSAYHSADASSVRIDGDLVCSFRDMEFLSRYARGLPFADADRLGAMGHSYGAIAVLCWAALPGSSLRAFVTLDSGLEYVAIDDTGAEALKYHMRTNKHNIRAASLRFASAERKANFELLDPYLKYAPRYEATVASLSHNDYLTQGAVRAALMPEKGPDAKKARRTGYDRVCEHVLYFLDTTLKQQAAARERSIRGEGLDQGFKLQFKPSAPIPPTNRQLALHVKRHGVEKTAEWLQSFPNQPKGKLSAAAFVLLQDGDAQAALPVLVLVARDCPKLAGVQAMLGQARALTGDREGAVAAFRRAAELLPGDETVGGLRAYWKYVIEQGLKDLGGPETQPKRR